MKTCNKFNIHNYDVTTELQKSDRNDRLKEGPGSHHSFTYTGLWFQ